VDVSDGGIVDERRKAPRVKDNSGRYPKLRTEPPGWLAAVTPRDCRIENCRRAIASAPWDRRRLPVENGEAVSMFVGKRTRQMARKSPRSSHDGQAAESGSLWGEV
jgi:hypothetical protein